MIERFQLGFANRTLGYRLPEKNRKAGEELRGRLQRSASCATAATSTSTARWWCRSSTRPATSSRSTAARSRRRLRKGTPLHLYLPGPHRGVWNVEALPSSKEVILCEALIDALTFWCAGYRNVTSGYGVNGFTAEHLEAFQRHGIERVLIAYDRDEAGDERHRSSRSGWWRRASIAIGSSSRTAWMPMPMPRRSSQRRRASACCFAVPGGWAAKSRPRARLLSIAAKEEATASPT